MYQRLARERLAEARLDTPVIPFGRRAKSVSRRFHVNTQPAARALRRRSTLAREVAMFIVFFKTLDVFTERVLTR